ncbi:MAG: DNA-3-methyladenine glycosylase [Candidatus Paceibacterota bacterium]|jgi:DNA-3-methyladenine glycosylase
MGALPTSFYDRPTEIVAKELLGSFLCREIGGKVVKGKIVETEAYLGVKDLACHTSKGKTPRNEVMFGPPGRAYVYFIYGMYHCFNIVSEKEGNPCAVLIRALEPTVFCSDNTKYKQLNGPAKLCREFKIDKELNGWDLTSGKKLWIEDGEKIGPDRIKKSKRIGVDYAGAWKDKLLRFYIKNNEYVSKK